MQLCSESADLAAAAGGGKRWRRVAEAVAAAPGLPAGPAFSIGDSLTYRHGTGAVLGTDDLVGRRRYQFVVAALDGDVLVEVAQKTALTATAPYSDLTDRQRFSGPATLVTVPRGGLLVVDIDEAARILPESEADAVLLHVTIED